MIKANGDATFIVYGRAQLLKRWQVVTGAKWPQLLDDLRASESYPDAGSILTGVNIHMLHIGDAANLGASTAVYSLEI